MIGGFIIFFSVITNMLKISGFLRWLSLILSRIIPFDFITPEIISSLFIGFMEVTNGARECASLQVPLIYKTVLVSFMIGFGGLSVNAQVISIISETNLKINIYLFLKLVQGVAAAVYSYILVVWFSDLQVFNQNYAAETGLWNTYANSNWIDVFMNSSLNQLLILAFMLGVTLLKQKRLVKQSLFKWKS
jgi:nucleoside recognition membrane protein YjiH